MARLKTPTEKLVTAFAIWLDARDRLKSRTSAGGAAGHHVLEAFDDLDTAAAALAAAIDERFGQLRRDATPTRRRTR